MANRSVLQPEAKTAALLNVADFLARPQRFVAVAEARAGLRETLEQAQMGSVVLTNNGTPAVDGDAHLLTSEDSDLLSLGDACGEVRMVDWRWLTTELKARGLSD